MSAVIYLPNDALAKMPVLSLVQAFAVHGLYLTAKVENGVTILTAKTSEFTEEAALAMLDDLNNFTASLSEVTDSMCSHLSAIEAAQREIKRIQKEG
jgi:hypothetical protein